MGARVGGMTRREILDHKRRIDALLAERKGRMEFVRQAPTEMFREFAQDMVDAVDREIEAIRVELTGAWA